MHASTPDPRARAIAKSATAFRTISEVSTELDVPQHVLRFWETRFPQIKPMKRGGGRRYYRPGDVDLLKGIRVLLYGKGYTIRGVQRILREEGVAHVTSIGRGDIAAVPQPAEEPANGSPKLDQTVLRGGGGGRDDAVPLSDAQLRELKLALDDLAAARRILAGRSG